jgi:predicted ATPase
MSHLRLVDHTLLACSVKISILSAESNIDEALKIGIEVLKRIGEPIIDKPRRSHTILYLLQFRHRLKRTSPECIRRLPLMTDTRKAAAMLIMNQLIMPASFGRASLMLILVCKLFQITMKSGLCNISSVAIGWCGLVLIALGKIELASEYGKLALELLNSFDRFHECIYAYSGVSLDGLKISKKR